MDKNFIKELMGYKLRAQKWIRRSDAESCGLEKNTTVKFIIPLLEILGWDPLSKEVEFEYPVYNKEKKKTDHVDIALYTKSSLKKGIPKILVEIKRIQDRLGSGRQMLKYLQNTKVSRGIYTNGQELKLIAKLGVRKGFWPRVLFHLKNLNDFVEYKEILYLFSKKSLERNELDRLAKYLNSGNDYWAWFRQNKSKYSKNRLPLIYAKEKLKDFK